MLRHYGQSLIVGVLNRKRLLLALVLLCVLQPLGFAATYTLTLTGKPGAERERERLQLDMKLGDFEYTGLYLSANTALMIQVNTLQGDVTPSLLVGTFDLDDSEPRVLELNPGANTVTDEQGGVLYLRFPNPGSEASFTFSDTALQVPTFTLGTTTQTQWQEQLANLNPDVPSAALLSERAMIVVSRDAAIQYQDKDQVLLLQTVDQILDTEDEMSGLGAAQRSPYRYLMVEHHNPDYYMFATDYRTAFHQDAVQYVLDPALLRQDGWGPWHELGHTHQQRAWMWEAMIEVTVNIYSLAVQRAFGQESRTEETWSEVERYLALPDEERNFNGDDTDLFVRLGMLEQLRLAFGDEFYQELHRQTRKLIPDLSTDDEKIAYFAYRTSQIARRDLRGFYDDWGLELSQQTLEDIESLHLPLPDPDLITLGW
jgi:hypothetical protein